MGLVGRVKGGKLQVSRNLKEAPARCRGLRSGVPGGGKSVCLSARQAERLKTSVGRGGGRWAAPDTTWPAKGLDFVQDSGAAGGLLLGFTLAPRGRGAGTVRRCPPPPPRPCSEGWRTGGGVEGCWKDGALKEGGVGGREGPPQGDVQRQPGSQMTMP